MDVAEEGQREDAPHIQDVDHHVHPIPADGGLAAPEKTVGSRQKRDKDSWFRKLPRQIDHRSSKALVAVLR